MGQSRTMLNLNTEVFNSTPAMPLNDFETIERIIGKFNFLGSLFCGRVSEVSTLHMRMKKFQHSIISRRSVGVRRRRDLTKTSMLRSRKRLLRLCPSDSLLETKSAINKQWSENILSYLCLSLIFIIVKIYFSISKKQSE